MSISAAPNVPTTCAQVRQRIPDAADGNYWLQLATGDTALLYCHQMASSPQAFINLVAGTSTNYATDYRAAAGTTWTQWAKTYYEKLAIDTHVRTILYYILYHTLHSILRYHIVSHYFLSYHISYM